MLAASTFGLSILDNYYLRHIPEALPSHFYLLSPLENQSHFINFAMVMRPTKSEIAVAVHGC